MPRVSNTIPRAESTDAHTNRRKDELNTHGTGTSRPRRGCAVKQAAALELLAVAAQRVESDDTIGSRHDLRKAVDAARKVGVGWTMIGDVLGIASGNAYQRYRKRPAPSAVAVDRFTADAPGH